MEDYATFVSPPERVSSKAELNSRELKRAVKRAWDFVHKFNPSGYDEESAFASDEDEDARSAPSVGFVRSSADTPATLYGRWWHALLQQISWPVGVEEAEAIFLQYPSPFARKGHVPSPRWKLVREKLFSDPILTRFLWGNDMQAHAEFPFVWKVDDRACIEGVVDLLAIDQAAGQCSACRLEDGSNRKESGRTRGASAAALSSAARRLLESGSRDRETRRRGWHFRYSDGRIRSL